LGGGIAGGCAVPGILAARTLRSSREKLATVLTVPFMACGAKLPVFILFAGVFFPGHQALVLLALTLTGWLVAMLTACILRLTIIRGPATPFVMELPPYRFPTIKGVLIHSLERTWQFLKKAGTVILAISILLWASMTYPGLPEERTSAFEDQRTELRQILEEGTLSGEELHERLEQVDRQETEAALRYSVAGRIGAGLEPVARLAGFSWEATVALLGGFAAKEVIVSTLATAYSLYGSDEDQGSLVEHIEQSKDWNTASAVAFLLFVLLYAPCFVSLVIMRQETGSTAWAMFSFVFNTLVAFAVAVTAFQIGRILLA
jgi:ferrous iron transport protein B